MRQIWIPHPGRPEVLEVREARDPLPQRGQLRIRVEAAGVNFADVMGRLGSYPDLPPMPCVPGYEVAGSVDTVGEGVETDWIGRGVLAWTRFGGYADTVVVDEGQCFARPAGMTALEGAAVPVNYLTAFQLVCVMGSLRAGDTVLVHSAGGGVGIAAIQLAHHLGARVIGTASAGKHDFLKAHGVEHAIDYTREKFDARVLELTHGRGVELVLDAVGGSSFRRSYRVLGPTGRLGMFGFSSAVTGKRRSRWAELRGALAMPWFRFNPLALMNANKGVFGVNLGHLFGEAPRIGGWMEQILRLYVDGAVRPVVAQSFPFDRAAEAHHYLQDRRNTGKILLVP